MWNFQKINKSMVDRVKVLKSIRIDGITLTKELIVILFVWLVPVLLAEAMVVAAVAFDYKVEVMARFIPLTVDMFEKMYSVAAVGALIAFAKVRKDSDHNGIPDDFEDVGGDKP